MQRLNSTGPRLVKKIHSKRGHATRMLGFFPTQSAESDLEIIRQIHDELLHVETSLAVTLARALECYRRDLEALVKAFHADTRKVGAEAAMERLEDKIEIERNELQRVARPTK